MKVKGLLLLLMVLFVLVVSGFIGSQNSHIVAINYILAETEMRMSVLLAITFVLGILFTTILASGYILRLKWQVKSLERKNKKLTQASHSL